METFAINFSSNMFLHNFLQLKLKFRIFFIIGIKAELWKIKALLNDGLGAFSYSNIFNKFQCFRGQTCGRPIPLSLKKFPVLS
jgi:hypothetical protein